MEEIIIDSNIVFMITLICLAIIPIIFWACLRKRERKQEAEVKIGDIFAFDRREEKNPFIKEKGEHKVEVIDIRDGYVKYKGLFDCKGFVDSCSIKSFIRMYYKKVENDENK